MTKPKKEKCEACCGDGYIGFRTDDGHISLRTCRRCDGYGYIKVKQMTNEQWFTSLSTEEKAEWLFKLTHKCYWCGREYTPRSLSLYNEKECPLKKCMKDKKDFEKWLKEKHE